jgi:hypothetical protein
MELLIWLSNYLFSSYLDYYFYTLLIVGDIHLLKADEP